MCIFMGLPLMTKPYRCDWDSFPDVVLHAGETAVKKHPEYAAAKSGDSDAAFALVNDLVSESAITELIKIAGGPATVSRVCTCV